MREKIYPIIIQGRFLDRPNRFVAHVEIDGEVKICHMPNPGRMRELLFPGVTLYVTPQQNPKSRTAYRIVGVQKESHIFYLDTSRCNDVAAYLVNHQLISGWEDYFVIRREVSIGDSRFDLLLCHRKTGETFPVEVKSCSLAGRKGTMFPDAPTERGTKHIRHLTSIAQKQGHAGLLIIAHYDEAEWFLPDMHTDPTFAFAFAEAMDMVDWKTVVISWSSDFYMPDGSRLIPSSKEAIMIEGKDRGVYLLVLYVGEEIEKSGEKRREFYIPRGYYVYVGWASKNLEKQMNRYRRKRKRIIDNIDFIRQRSSFIGVIPIRGQEDLSKTLVQMLNSISDWEVQIPFGEGKKQIFGFSFNPMHNKSFVEVEVNLQIDRLNIYFEK